MKLSNINFYSIIPTQSTPAKTFLHKFKLPDDVIKIIFNKLQQQDCFNLAQVDSSTRKYILDDNLRRQNLLLYKLVKKCGFEVAKIKKELSEHPDVKERTLLLEKNDEYNLKENKQWIKHFKELEFIHIQEKTEFHERIKIEDLSLIKETYQNVAFLVNFDESKAKKLAARKPYFEGLFRKLIQFNTENTLKMLKSYKGSYYEKEALLELAQHFEKTDSPTALDYLKESFEAFKSLAPDTTNRSGRSDKDYLLKLFKILIKHDFSYCLDILKILPENPDYPFKAKAVESISKKLNPSQLEQLFSVINLFPFKDKIECLDGIADNLKDVDADKLNKICEDALTFVLKQDNFHYELRIIASCIKTINKTKALELLKLAFQNTMDLIDKIPKDKRTYNSYYDTPFEILEKSRYRICTTMFQISFEYGNDVLSSIKDLALRSSLYCNTANTLGVRYPELALELLNISNQNNSWPRAGIISHLPTIDTSKIKNLIKTTDRSYQRNILYDVLKRVEGAKLLDFPDLIDKLVSHPYPFEQIPFLIMIYKGLLTHNYERAKDIEKSIFDLIKYKDYSDVEHPKEIFRYYLQFATAIAKANPTRSLELGKYSLELFIARPLYFYTSDLNMTTELLSELIKHHVHHGIKLLELMSRKFPNHDMSSIILNTVHINPEIAFDLIMKIKSNYKRCLILTNCINRIFSVMNNDQL